MYVYKYIMLVVIHNTHTYSGLMLMLICGSDSAALVHVFLYREATNVYNLGMGDEASMSRMMFYFPHMSLDFGININY